MTIYFLSATPAILQLNGIHVGLINSFERKIDVDITGDVMAQITPDGNAQPVNFFINHKFLSAPPPCVDLYIGDGECVLFCKYFETKSPAFNVLGQTTFFGNTVTIFRQGTLFLSVDGASYFLHPLPNDFVFKHFEEHVFSNGESALFVVGEKCVAVLNINGELLFCDRADEFCVDGFAQKTDGFLGGAHDGSFNGSNFGGAHDDTIKGLAHGSGAHFVVTKRLATCRRIEQRREFALANGKLSLLSCATTEIAPLKPHLIPFAFFECALHGGDFAHYLCDGLKDRAHMLTDYLGDFCDVVVPTENFYFKHDETRAVGLVYRKKENLFNVEYFAVDLKDEKVSNVRKIT